MARVFAVVGMLSVITSIAFVVAGCYLRVFHPAEWQIIGIDKVYAIAYSLLTFAGVYLACGVMACTVYCYKGKRNGDNRFIASRSLGYTFVLGLAVVGSVPLFSLGGVVCHQEWLLEHAGSMIDAQIMTNYGFDPSFTNTIDGLQIDYECCGGTTHKVYNISKWSNHETPLSPKRGLVPESCCARTPDNLIADPAACHGTDFTIPNSINDRTCIDIIGEVSGPLLFWISSAAFILGGLWLCSFQMVKYGKKARRSPQSCACVVGCAVGSAYPLKEMSSNVNV